MLIKKESDYGIRIVRALRDGDKLSIREICEREDIPEAFAYKIIKKLHTTGLVVSERGANGGYLLAKELDEITMYDILISVEPDFAVIPCMHKSCTRNAANMPCRVHIELEQLQATIIKELQGKTMQQILNEWSAEGEDTEK